MSSRIKLLMYFGLAAAFGVSAAVVLWLYGVPALGIEGLYSKEYRQSLAAIETLANKEQEGIERLFSDRRSELRLMSLAESFSASVAAIGVGRSHMEKAFRERLQRQLTATKEASHSAYNYLYIVEPGSRRMLASTEPEWEEAPGEHISVLQEAARPGYAQFVRVINDSHGPGLLVTIQITAMDREGVSNGKPAGILVANLKLEKPLERDELSMQQTLGLSGAVWLVDSTPKVLYRFPAQDEGRDRDRIAALAVSGAAGVKLLKMSDGQELIFVSRQLHLGTAEELNLVVTRGINEAMASFDEIFIRLIVLGGTIFLLAMGIAIVAANRIAGVETALRTSEIRSRAITQSTHDAVVTSDRAGNIVGWNRGAETIFGYVESEVMGQPMTLLMPERYGDIHLAAMNSIRSGEDHQIFGKVIELNGMRKDGSNFPLDLSISKWETADGWFITGIIRDITERRQAELARGELEAQLRESQKMEALGTLAGGIAHDFNNALAAIAGNAELARQDVGPGHIALESIEEINKAARRAKDLVQQILAFGRRQPLERKPTTLSLVVLEAVRLVRATLPAGVTLNVECKADTPAVRADATQIKQILLNLCGNAIQAVQNQGRPGVIDVRLEAHARGGGRGDLQPGRHACLTVRDNGVGMDGATRARIFEPFFTTKPRGKGTGLGLSVVHGIVKAHEASIDVASVPGEGSEFHICFPAIDEPIAAAAAPVANPAPVDGQGKHILYIDDEEAIVFLMKRLLERRGYRVSTFTNPEKALAAVRADPAQFDLAVTDYNMQEMSGLEVAVALKEIRADLPVVLASGYITEELRTKAPAAGIRELIYKPDTVDDLCEAVARFANAQGEKGNPS